MVDTRDLFTKHDIEWAAAEVTRQLDTPMHVAYLLNGLHAARRCRNKVEFDLQLMIDLARIVNNDHTLSFRSVPVTFANGKRGLDPSLIIRALINLVNAIDIEPIPFYKEFEEIHPFIDGNGRVGSILYNWMMGTLHTPTAPPDVFGEEDPTECACSICE